MNFLYFIGLSGLSKIFEGRVIYPYIEKTFRQNLMFWKHRLTEQKVI